MTTLLALPPGGGSGPAAERSRSSVPLGVVALGCSALAAVGGMVAAYLSLRSGLRSEGGAWPPTGTEFDNYLASTLMITVLLASLLVEWAAHAVRRDFRGQALFGFGAATGVATAFVVGLAYLLDQLPFGPAESPYAASVYALVGVAFLIGLVGTGALLIGWLRAIGHQLTTANLTALRSVTLTWHIATVAWIAAFYTVYVSR